MLNKCNITLTNNGFKTLLIQNLDLNKYAIVIMPQIRILTFIKPTESNELKTLLSQTENNHFN